VCFNKLISSNGIFNDATLDSCVLSHGLAAEVAAHDDVTAGSGRAHRNSGGNLKMIVNDLLAGGPVVPPARFTL